MDYGVRNRNSWEGKGREWKGREGKGMEGKGISKSVARIDKKHT